MLPYITEKTLSLAKRGQYTLIVPRSNKKIASAKAVEEFFGVQVASIQILKKPSVRRRFRRQVGQGPILKKIIVRLKKGGKIPGFEVETGGKAKTKPSKPR